MFNNNERDKMKKCIICNSRPNEIWNWAFHGSICKPCMKRHGDSHHEKIGTGVYPNNYIPSDYYNLISNDRHH